MCVCMRESHLHTLAQLLPLVPHTEIWVVPQNWPLLKTHTHTHMHGNTETHTCMETSTHTERWICILTYHRCVDSEFEGGVTKICHRTTDFISKYLQEIFIWVFSFLSGACLTDAKQKITLIIN